MYELYLPPKPAIIRAAEPWEIKLSSWLTSQGVSRKTRRGVISELKRLDSANVFIQRESLKDLSLYSKTELKKGLILFAPIGWGSAAATVTGLTYIASVGSNSSSVNPGSEQAGDLIIYIDRASNNDSTYPTEVIPSGFTQIGTTVSQAGATTQRIRFVASYQVISGTLGATTGMDGSDADRKIALTIRPTGTITTVTPGSFGNTTATNGDPGDLSITSGSGAAPLIVIGCGVTFSANDANSALSTGADGRLTVSGAANRLDVNYKIYNSSPVNNDATMGDAGDVNFLVGFYLSVS